MAKLRNFLHLKRQQIPVLASISRSVTLAFLRPGPASPRTSSHNLKQAVEKREQFHFLPYSPKCSSRRSPQSSAAPAARTNLSLVAPPLSPASERATPATTATRRRPGDDVERASGGAPSSAAAFETSRRSFLRMVPSPSAGCDETREQSERADFIDFPLSRVCPPSRRRRPFPGGGVPYRDSQLPAEEALLICLSADWRARTPSGRALSGR